MVFLMTVAKLIPVLESISDIIRIMLLDWKTPKVLNIDSWLFYTTRSNKQDKA